jgi:hypothetical protein
MGLRHKIAVGKKIKREICRVFCQVRTIAFYVRWKLVVREEPPTV